MNEVNKKSAEAPRAGPTEEVDTARPPISEQSRPAPADSEDTGQPMVSGETHPAPTAADAEVARLNEEVRRRMRRQTRRSFLAGGVAALAATAGWRWLLSRREDDGIPWPFRRALEINEELARDYFRRDRQAPTLPPEAAREDRINGDIGLDDDFDFASWALRVEGLAASDQPVNLTLDAVRRLPRAEMTTELKCIEGWSTVVRWAGARFSDFMAAYPPAALSDDLGDSEHNPQGLPPYVSLETPDGGYYVGLEIESMLHPQTLLCYEMNGGPLTPEHGAPLRLVIPLKYGIKNIKRIGTLRYAHTRPADYWAERGYDWYVGL